MGLKRKVDGEDGLAGVDIAKASRIEPPAPEHGKRSMQGQQNGGGKHSIDSDDEDDEKEAFEKFEEMKDEDIEGQVRGPPDHPY